MKVINQGFEIIQVPKDANILTERIGRTCYKSEDRITDESAEKFCKMLIAHGHHAMIEFNDIIVKLTTNRGVTHELVRHRHCSFAQESTRYVDYSKFMLFIKPVWLSDDVLGEWTTDSYFGELDTDEEAWVKSMLRAEQEYLYLKSLGWKSQQAREVLPNSLKTEINVKANIREWMHIFALRCAKASHPQMVQLMRALLKELYPILPIYFEPFYEKYIVNG